MKRTLIVFAALVGSIVAVHAQDTNQEGRASEAVVSGERAEKSDKQRIKTDELPDAVKRTLEDQEYKGWLINTAFHDKRKEQYEVELKNGADTQVITFSQEGARIDD